MKYGLQMIKKGKIWENVCPKDDELCYYKNNICLVQLTETKKQYAHYVIGEISVFDKKQITL